MGADTCVHPPVLVLVLALCPATATFADKDLAVRIGVSREAIKSFAGMWDTGMGQDAAVELGARAVPMQRIGESDEVAAAVCWLCSDEASYITGAIVNVSGGRELFVRS